MNNCEILSMKHLKLNLDIIVGTIQNRNVNIEHGLNDLFIVIKVKMINVVIDQKEKLFKTYLKF